MVIIIGASDPQDRTAILPPGPARQSEQRRTACFHDAQSHWEEDVPEGISEQVNAAMEECLAEQQRLPRETLSGLIPLSGGCLLPVICW